MKKRFRHFKNLFLVVLTSLLCLCACTEVSPPTPPPIPDRDLWLGITPDLSKVEDLACIDGRIGLATRTLNQLESNLVRKFGNEISLTDEKKYARAFHEYVTSNFTLVEDTRSKNLELILEKLVAVVHQELPNQTHPHYEIFLIDSPKDNYVNAFTPSGGKIYFSTDLYTLTRNDAERSFVIGHEIAHGLLGHISDKHRRQSIIKNAVEDKQWQQSLTSFWDMLATPLDSHDELGCDLSSAYINQQAGFDAEEGRHLFYRMNALQPQERSMLRYLRSHPHMDTRTACLGNYLLAGEERMRHVSAH